MQTKTFPMLKKKLRNKMYKNNLIIQICSIGAKVELLICKLNN